MNQIINLRRVIDLGSEFVTLAEAKKQLLVDFSDDDTAITALIPKARRHVENYCNISIVYQRIECTARLCSNFKLPYGPVIGIEGVADNSTAGFGSGPVSFSTTTTPWSSDGDLFLPGGFSDWNTPVANVSLRSTAAPSYHQKITYTAGNFCPDDLKDCILQVLTFLYENRGREAKVAELQDILTNADRYRVVAWI